MANYLSAEYPGTLVEDFETFADWTISGNTGAVGADETTLIKTGSHSLKLTTAATGSKVCNATKTINTVFPLDVWGMWIYVPDTSVVTGGWIYLSSTTTALGSITKYHRAYWSVERSGWSFVVFQPSDWTAAGGEVWSDAKVRMHVTLTNKAGGVGVAYFDSLYRGFRGRCQCVLEFDDLFESHATFVQGVLDTYGLKGTFNATQNLVGTAGYCSVAQVDALVAAGHAIGNQCVDHEDLTLKTQAAAQAQMADCAAYIRAQGWSKNNSDLHAVYPVGPWNATVVAAAQAAGMLTGRTTNLDPVDQMFGLAQPYALPVYGMSASITLAAGKAYFDAMLAKGTTGIFLFHDLVEADDTGNDWLQSDFEAWIAYIMQFSQQFDNPTRPEWFNRLDGARRPR